MLRRKRENGPLRLPAKIPTKLLRGNGLPTNTTDWQRDTVRWSWPDLKQTCFRKLDRDRLPRLMHRNSWTCSGGSKSAVSSRQPGRYGNSAVRFFDTPSQLAEQSTTRLPT